MARRRPLCGVQELRRRVETGAFRPATAFALLTGLFDALNDVDFEAATERLRLIEADLLHRRFRFEIERYAALVEDCHDFADQCQFVLDEVRAQVAEETNSNLYVLTIFSVVFLPATLLAGFWGMNVGGIPMSDSADGFWEVTGLVALVIALNLAILRLGRFF